MHYQKMKVYKEVPIWWFLVLFAITLVVNMAARWVVARGEAGGRP